MSGADNLYFEQEADLELLDAITADGRVDDCERVEYEAIKWRARRRLEVVATRDKLLKRVLSLGDMDRQIMCVVKDYQAVYRVQVAPLNVKPTQLRWIGSKVEKQGQS